MNAALTPQTGARRGLWVRAAALLLLLAGAAAITAVVGLPSQSQLRHTVHGWGWWAPIGFAGLYAAVTLSPLPKTVFTVLAGAIFGIPVGMVSVLAGAMLGAVTANLLARRLGRQAVQRIARGRLDRLQGALAARGFTTVLVARLIPVLPFTTINYLAGLTRIPLPAFTTATVLGIIPATTAYVVLGAYDTRPSAWLFWAATGTLAVLTAAGLVAGVVRRRRGRVQSQRPG